MARAMRKRVFGHTRTANALPALVAQLDDRPTGD